jgi:exodeoxyribonuclease VIII
MLDLETLGLDYNAAIISIGAVKFDPKAYDLHEPLGKFDIFYAAITHESARRHGTVDAVTIEWWGKQPIEARNAAFNSTNARELSIVLYEFNEWAKDCDGVWGNGATFDNVIIRSALKSCGIEPSWSFRDDKCFRTVCNLVDKENQPPVVRYGTHHNAVDDAITQALHLQKVYKILGLS